MGDRERVNSAAQTCNARTRSKELGYAPGIGERPTLKAGVPAIDALDVASCRRISISACTACSVGAALAVSHPFTSLHER